MPTVRLPADSIVTLNQSTAGFLTWPYGPHIYLALGTLAVLAVVRSATVRFWPRKLRPRVHKAERKGWQAGYLKDSATSFVPTRSPTPTSAPSICVAHSQPALDRPTASLRASVLGQEPKPVTWATDLLAGSPVVLLGSLEPVTVRPPEMDGHGSRRKRGESTRMSRPMRSSSSGRHSGSSDGADNDRQKGKGKSKSKSKGKGLVDGDNDGDSSSSSAIRAQSIPLREDATEMYMDGTRDGDHTPAIHFSRPPLPPPLTPPTLSSRVFAFQDRRPSDAVSVPPELDSPTFVARSKPNPFTSFSSTDGLAVDGDSRGFSGDVHSRRRSYVRTMPIVTTSGGTRDFLFSSSYPPTSPLLPPPPPEDTEGTHAFTYDPDELLLENPIDAHGFPVPQEIDVHGEIISVMDGAGHGWKRHTRVYGGGVCLACAAAGGEGGYYGDTVPPEHKR